MASMALSSPHHLDWHFDFLQVKQVVLGESSDISPVLSGVPQGTVLGPLLFLAYITNLPDCISNDTQARQFADDCVIIQNHQ